MPLFSQSRAALVQKEKRDIGAGVFPLQRARDARSRLQVEARECRFNQFGRPARRRRRLRAFHRERPRSRREKRNANDQAHCEPGRNSPIGGCPWRAPLGASPAARLLCENVNKIAHNSARPQFSHHFIRLNIRRPNHCDGSKPTRSWRRKAATDRDDGPPVTADLLRLSDEKPREHPLWCSLRFTHQRRSR